jgi:pyridinium-3,5-biscarboxylic acid mononucleotide synthase
MTEDELKVLLQAVRDGSIVPEEAGRRIRGASITDLGFATLDMDRESRTGSPEVIYCSGKTSDQIVSIAAAFYERRKAFLATRVEEAVAGLLTDRFPEAEWNPLARTVSVGRADAESVTESYVAVVAAGTSDLPVADEARVTAEYLGSRVESVTDVGVAGIHRLFAKIEIIRGAKVVVAAAGMEGALASVVGGLVDKPVIALPTSVGYGSSFGGMTALLAMLNSCAPGVAVVNIDNGFGAGYLANLINRL